MIAGLAVSSIAWAAAEDDAVAAMLRDEGVRGIELAPTAWREDPYEAPRDAIEALRDRWAGHGFSVVSLQALLFGRPDLQLFGSDADRVALASYLKKAVDFAQVVGAHALVFGSPKNRLRGDVSLDMATKVARDFFASLAPYAHERGTAICLEANPPGYGCDFLTATADAVDLCRSIDHPGIRVNGDLGGMLMAGENISGAIEHAAPWLGHFHASEPNLAELVSRTDHERVADALRAARYTGWVSIEMRRSHHADALRRAVRFARDAYLSS